MKNSKTTKSLKITRETVRALDPNKLAEVGGGLPITTSYSPSFCLACQR